MMMTTAGGPTTITPFAFNQRRGPRLSRTSWIAIGIVAMAHVGVGVALYNQRFENPPMAGPVEPPTIFTTLERPPIPKPLPDPKPVPQQPAAPNVSRNTPLPTQPTDVLNTPVSDAKPGDSLTLTFDQPVEKPVVNTPPAVQPQPPAVITRPSWDRQPNGDQLMRAYPRRALEAGVAGSASLNCLVQANGSVSDCQVTAETPGGYGFGRAAQSLSRYFRINPRTVNGSAEGSRVAIGLRFNLPEG